MIDAVQSHLGHVGILQQELDRPEPDDLVGNLDDHARELTLREDRAARLQEIQRSSLARTLRAGRSPIPVYREG